MGPGGAERVIAQIANGLDARGHDVSLLTYDANGDPSFYPLKQGVRMIPLGLNSLPRRPGAIWVIEQIFRLLRGLRQQIRVERPDVLVAFITQTNIFALLACAGLRVPVVVSERSDPLLTPLRSPWKVARAICYPFAAGLVVQSREVREGFPSWIRRKTCVLPNPVSMPVASSVQKCEPTRLILAVGRLSREKGFDLLLEAFKNVVAEFPEWRLEIRGEGPLRGELEDLRDTLGLQDRVSLPGIISEIHHCYIQADIFVLSSRFEGFPNALCEAMAHGLPVVATSCSGGVREIIKAGENGLLVPPEDVDALGRALSSLVANPELRKALGERARDIVERFGVEIIMDKWEAYLAKMPLKWT